MFGKLLTALLLVLAVLYIGDPYSAKNQALTPYLPPAPSDSDIAQLRDITGELVKSIELDDTLQTVSEHEITHSILQSIDALRIALIEMLMDYSKDRQLLARTEE